MGGSKWRWKPAAALAAALVCAGCSGSEGRAELPDGRGVISTSNPITSSQAGDVVKSGQVLTQRILDVFAAKGVEHVRDSGEESWDACTAAKGRLPEMYPPRNGIQYKMAIVIDALPDAQAVAAKLSALDLDWTPSESRATAAAEPYTVNVWLDATRARLRVLSPCYFVRDVDAVSADEIERIGGFYRQQWESGSG